MYLYAGKSDLDIDGEAGKARLEVWRVDECGC
jgi:hypothetical protein